MERKYYLVKLENCSNGPQTPFMDKAKSGCLIGKDKFEFYFLGSLREKPTYLHIMKDELFLSSFLKKGNLEGMVDGLNLEEIALEEFEEKTKKSFF